MGHWLCDQPNDQQAALPTIDTIPPELGPVNAVNLDTGYFSQGNIAGLEERKIEPYIATGRTPHHQSWRAYFQDQLAPLPEAAPLKEQMAYKLQTDIGQAMYRLRKSTVEPVLGIIKEVIGFRQFSLRGLFKVSGEWTLVVEDLAGGQAGRLYEWCLSSGNAPGDVGFQADGLMDNGFE